MYFTHIIGKDVVEIGSGCGLVGITAAVLGARSVTLTDISAQQFHIERNIEINRPHWEGRCARVESGVLQFGDTRVSKLSSLSGYQEISEIGSNFQVVLGADIGYDLSLHEPIARTLSFLLNSKRKLHSVACSNDIIRGTEDYNRMISLHSEVKIALLVEEIRWHDIHRWYIETLLAHKIAPITNAITGKERIEMSSFLEESLLEELDNEKSRVIEGVKHNKNTGQLQCFSSFPFEAKNNSYTRENKGTECLTYDEVLENILGRKKSSIHFLQLQVTT